MIDLKEYAIKEMLQYFVTAAEDYQKDEDAHDRDFPQEIINLVAELKEDLGIEN